MIVKVCGMRDAENIREVERLGIDMMGFICWPRSPRFVAEVPAYLPKCPRVGVFVDAPIDFIRQRVEVFGFSHVQLHGSETPEFCQEVRQKTGCKVIKAISISPSTSSPLPRTLPRGGGAYAAGLPSSSGEGPGEGAGVSDLLLFDTKCATAGGSGRQFNWDILDDYHDSLPFLLSGGIGPEDAGRLKQWHHPKCVGFDINSRFETAPGIKDIEKIKAFISSIRTHEQNKCSL